VWLELLSIADRNEGRVPLDSDSCLRGLSVKCNSTLGRVRLILDWIVTKTWVVSDPTPRIRNWLIYNPSRETNKTPPGTLTASPPILPILSYPKKDPKKEPPAVDNLKPVKKTLDPQIKAVADRIYASDPAKFRRLVVWIKSVEALDYQPAWIAQALTEFEKSGGDLNGEWWPYLDKIGQKVRTKFLQDKSPKKFDPASIGAILDALKRGTAQ
jgi:hypothetical protein